MRKRQHYVPEMVLRRFTSDGEWLFVYCKKDARPAVRRSKTNNAFLVGHGYSKIGIDGTKTAEQEARFSEMEALWSTALDQAIESAQSGSIAGAQALREPLSEFFYYQWIRTPEFLQSIEGYSHFEPMLEHFVRQWVTAFRPLNADEQKVLVGPEAAKRLRQNTIVDSLSHAISAPVARVLGNCRFDIVLLGDQQGPFIIGSKPVIVVKRPQSALMITPAKTDIWLPFASRAAIKLVPFLSGIGTCTATDREVQAVNDTMLAECELIGGETAEVIQAVLNRSTSPLRVTNAVTPSKGTKESEMSRDSLNL